MTKDQLLCKAHLADAMNDWIENHCEDFDVYWPEDAATAMADSAFAVVMAMESAQTMYAKEHPPKKK